MSEKVIIKNKTVFKKKLIDNIIHNMNVQEPVSNKKKTKATKATKSTKAKSEFDPFEIYPDKIESNKPVLLVDLGYTTFYRFNAAKTWYKHSHPEEKETFESEGYDWGDNKEFMDKFDKKYVEELLLVAKKYRIPHHNIVMARDCKSCDNWRGKLYKEYKLTRKMDVGKKGFDGEKVFKHAYEYTFDAMVKNYGFKLIKHKDIEADDVNAIITQYYQKHFPNVHVYILATDKDYLQLGNGKMHLIDFKGRLLNDKKDDTKLNDGHYQLWYKILIGDKSDNIPAVKIKRKYIRPNAKTGIDSYINITKKDGEMLASPPNLSKLMSDFEEDPELLKQSQLDLNCQLIDFNMIPAKYRNIVTKELEKYFI